LDIGHWSFPSRARFVFAPGAGNRQDSGRHLHPAMNFKVFLRTILFLAILFVFIYTAMENREDIDFYFPLLLTKKITAPAPIVLFALFAVGVFGGTLLHAGGGKSKGGDSARRK
jgi:uncharacterized integral membrane protein